VETFTRLTIAKAPDLAAPGRVTLSEAVLVAALLLLQAVVPWTGERPRSTSAPPPPLASPCRAADLEATVFLQGAGGAMVGGVTLTNAGFTACSLVGRPKISLAGTRTWPMPLPRPAPEVVRDPMSSLRALRPKRRARFALHWSNWCARRPATATIALPGGDRLRLWLGQPPRCESAASPSALGVSPFVPGERTLGPRSRLPLRAEIVGARVPAGKPGLRAFRARRGGELRYIVALTNVSRRPFRFRSCPVFRQTWGGPYVLNCRSVGTIAPGQTVRFRMVLRIPDREPLGVTGISWILARKTYRPPFATAALLVVR
jgi:hypothetical protein